MTDTVDILAPSELISSLDYGPSECQLDRILRLCDDAKAPSSHRTRLGLFLGYADSQSNWDLVKRLCVAIDKYHSLNPDAKKRAISVSVARWIYLTNKLEFESVDSEADTLTLIQHVLKKNKPQSEQTESKVLHHKHAPNIQHTFKLLQITYDPLHYKHDEPKSCLTMDEDKLKTWINTLLPHIHSYREHGAESSGGAHAYPHHNTIKQSMDNLMRMVYNLFNSITFLYKSHPYRVLYAFALAAFTQFHFVDIHPFADGNGRMCRFISKRILDWVCPIPFMFSNRDEYIDALVKGRTLSSTNTPSLLLNLLLKCATEHYEDMVRGKCTFDHLFVATSESNLETQLKKENLFTEQDIEEMKKKFNEIQSQSTQEIKINDMIIALKRDNCVEFDEI